ncbi:T4 family baseplate hub assembly chaperone [Streptomyces sp. H27-D2]|uniref:T4 family baseplate hub assembly chaperone n=1 Tax=Streptomyces sp. H27-D2 TaxID=3046304 RepID=UPI002DBBEA70|nr:hypothetical protein [Streptomyces sp. H27-D2]MEC4018797.1 hypothetical protein [Streptomyces sp. H27-D2]
MGSLPGGYWDATGRLHREFELAALTGREEELLVQARQPQTATLVTEVLSRCVRRLGDISPVPSEVARQLLVADRHYLLLQLRRATFGDLVHANLICPWPDCGERVSLDFSLAEVPVEEARHRAPVHTMTLSAAAPSGSGTAAGGCQVSFRLPNGADQEELSEQLAHNEARALTLLLTRCVQRLGSYEPPEERQLAELSASARSEIEERMQQLAPKVEQTMEAACAECGRTIVAPFDIQRFFLGELRTDGELLYREVHYLAYHYHWSEHEIMEFTRDKRRKYIDVLADTIEVLNSGA